MITRQPPRRWGAREVAVTLALVASGCEQPQVVNQVRVSGYVEAEEVRLASEVGGRLLVLHVTEGDRVDAGELVAELATTEVELALQQVHAERRQAEANLRLLQAGARPEDIQQAEAQVAATVAELAAVRSELALAETDLERFESLLQADAGSRQQRDTAATRRDVGRERVTAANERVEATRATLARFQAGARQEEIEAARARVAVTEARIATLENDLSDARLRSPVSGIVTEELATAGELVSPGMPLLVLTDLDHAWANVYLDEPYVPRIRLNQSAIVFTDAGGAGMPGTIAFVSPRAEFTPRNVQTAEERSKLVYRLKIDVDNRDGVLKQGMPVEAQIDLQPSS